MQVCSQNLYDLHSWVKFFCRRGQNISFLAFCPDLKMITMTLLSLPIGLVGRTGILVAKISLRELLNPFSMSSISPVFYYLQFSVKTNKERKWAVMSNEYEFTVKMLIIRKVYKRAILA